MIQPRRSQVPSPADENSSGPARDQRSASNQTLHAVAEVLHDYETTWNALDPRALLGLFSHDGMFIYGGRPMRSGQTEMKSAVERMLDPDYEIRLEIEHLKTHGVIAYVKSTLRWYERGSAETSKPTCEKRGLFVLRRRPEGWFIAHHILSRVLAVAD